MTAAASASPRIRRLTRIRIRQQDVMAFRAYRPAAISCLFRTATGNGRSASRFCVHVSQLPPPHAELDPAVAMGRHGDTVPRADLALNLCQEGIAHG